MSRPPCCRRVRGAPATIVYGPQCARARRSVPIVMTLDEFEALRLAHLEQLYYEKAAAQMDVSRPTFGRIIESAHRKVAEALVHGRMLKIEGGAVRLDQPENPPCPWCVPGTNRRPDCCRAGTCPGSASRYARIYWVQTGSGTRVLDVTNPPRERKKK